MDIELHIDHLVLHGFERMSQKRIAQAIEQELRQVLVRNGLPHTLQKPRTVRELHAGAFRMRTGDKPNRIGQQVGQQIYRGLSK